MDMAVKEAVGERVEVRRDSRSGIWSLFAGPGETLLGKAEKVFLADVQFLVIESKARAALAQRRANNAAWPIRGTLLAAEPKPARGFMTVHYTPTRARTWLLARYPQEVTQADVAICMADGSVVIPTPHIFGRQDEGTKGRRPVRATQLALSRQLRKVEADFWLTHDQPLKSRAQLAKYGCQEPAYAILPNADPWTDTPLFFSRLPQLRAWIANQRLGNPASSPAVEDFLARPFLEAKEAKPLELPFDIVSYYRARVEEVGYVFHPGKQPLDWHANGTLLYVLVQRSGPKNAPWQNFTFKTREELEEWLVLQHEQNMIDDD